ISSLPAVVYDEAPRAVLSRSLTWSLRNCFAALATSGVNCSRTRWVKEPSYTLAVRYLIQSGDGLRNSSTIARLIAPTYFSSSAALMIDSRSKLSLVSFRSSGTSDTSILLTAEPVECTVSNDLHRRKKAARGMPGSTFQTIAIVLYFAGMLTIGYF